MKAKLPLGLYAITDADLLPPERLLDAVTQAIAGGARVIQYRDKRSPTALRLSQAQALMRLCRAQEVPLIINDDVTLAATVGADGVHIGKDDMGLQEVRSQLPSAVLIGVSCYNRLDLALDAARSGADYVAFGSFFPSVTKPEAVQADLELLRTAYQTLNLPIVAIGGITPSNGSALVTAGAHCLAVISGVFGAPDIRVAAQAYYDLYATRTA